MMILQCEISIAQQYNKVRAACLIHKSNDQQGLSLLFFGFKNTFDPPLFHQGGTETSQRMIFATKTPLLWMTIPWSFEIC